MKKTLLAILVLSALIFQSCEKDETKTVLQDAIAPGLTLSANPLLLDETMAADTVERITWTPADYGFRAAVSYTLQLAKSGTDFATPKEYGMANKTTMAFTGADINQVALLQGIGAGSSGSLDVRVKETLSDSLSVYSDVSTLNITPYLVIIVYPSLWVPGEYQGWDPASAPKISSKLSNGNYEGYVNMVGGTVFKYTSDPDWSHTAYGWATSTTTGDDVSGTFNTTGGNLFVPSQGYYLLKGNTNDNSWSATRINSFSAIGDFNSWAADAPLTYDATTRVWTATLTAASDGFFKFRANNAWTYNFGDTGGDRLLEYDGANIPLSAGTHDVTLDLSVPGNYTYSIQ